MSRLLTLFSACLFLAACTDAEVRSYLESVPEGYSYHSKAIRGPRVSEIHVHYHNVDEGGAAIPRAEHSHDPIKVVMPNDGELRSHEEHAQGAYVPRDKTSADFRRFVNSITLSPSWSGND